MEDELIAKLIQGFGFYGIGAGIILLFCIIGELFLRWQERKGPFGGEVVGNLVLYSMGPFLEGLIMNALLLGGLFFFYNLVPLRVPVALWSLPIYFLVGDFAYYWYHRAGHEIRILWADHSIHHSAETYDFTVNLRLTPFTSLYRLVVWIPLVLLGFHPLILVLFATISPAFQALAHTERLGRFPAWFEWLFTTPCNHAVHHASNPIYIDKNYGGLLNIWDHLFGTYQRLEDHTPPTYGITRPVGSGNPFNILVHEFRYLVRDFAQAPSLNQKLAVLFGRPGHTFEAIPDTAPELTNSDREIGS